MEESLLHDDVLREIEQEIECVFPRAGLWEVHGVVWDFLSRGGKRFRPAMCELSCESVGGNYKKSLNTAAVIELFHNFTLIHDDIEDDSQLRRGQPCIHKIYGVPLAINAGDGLLLYALRALQKEPERVRAILYSGFINVLNGQGTELNWERERQWGIKEKDYLQMVEWKTSALISAACEAGAIIGNGNEKQVTALREFGTAVGTAFQIQDDVLNLIGEEAKYKKEIGGDITEGKRTLMVIHALKTLPEKDKKWLEKTLDSHTQDRDKINKAISMIKEQGSIAYAKAKAKELVENAKLGLSSLPKNKASEKLLAHADFLINREF